ncbi:phage holin family protein [Occallatibacter riparius]|uniref:Phage holin family protein n=1 Tax=Occallatibacter riparius TaxID=1002689 RepID=A0A9J7BYZ6_9BACT|nr:phage holin family protein [Occallatibacter riparius]UWZ86885.1 phage holin family protein [Occallatibacter riparius]
MNQTNHETYNHDVHNGRSFGSILFDAKEELKQFVETRITMLKTEMSENMKMLKVAAPLAAVGITMLLTAYVLFTLALVGLVVAFLPTNPYRWAIAFAAVAVLWTILGGVMAYFAKREFETRQLMPKKTMRVLKEDSVWIQREVRNQI